MDIDSPFIVLLLVFGTVAIFGSLIVIGIFLRTHVLKEAASQMILLVHLSCTGQMIATLPKIYENNWFICGFMGWFHYYCGLVNIIVIVLLTLGYYNLVTKNSLQFIERLEYYGLKIAFLFPIITFFPFSTGSYKAVNDWCTLEATRRGDLWAVFIFYIWITIGAIFCLIGFIYIIYRTSKFEIGEGVRGKLFASIGAYIMITVVCLVPQIIPRFLTLVFTPHGQSDDDTPYKDNIEFAIQFPLYLAGIAYSICYALNRSTLILYETRKEQAGSNEMRIDTKDLEEIYNIAQMASIQRTTTTGTDFPQRLKFIRELKGKDLPTDF